MKKLIVMAFIGVFSSPVFSSSILEGDYACRIGFLRLVNSDSLSIHSSSKGNLIINMNDDQYLLTSRCQIQGHPEIKSQCDEDGRVTLVKTVKGHKANIVTSVSFEKLHSMVIVRETINSGHGNSLRVYVCRPVN